MVQAVEELDDTEVAAPRAQGGRGPVVWAALVLGLAGWGLAAFTFWSAATTRDSFQQQIRSLEQERDKAASDLVTQREASGELSDLRTKVAAARDELARATAETQSRLAAARSQLAALEQQVQRARDQASSAPASGTEAPPAGPRAPATPPPRPRAAR